VIAILLQADEKKVTAFGHLRFHPVYITLGNLPFSVRMNSANWPVVAYLPILQFNEAESNTERARDARQKIYSRCLELLLLDLDVAMVRYARKNGEWEVT